MYGGGVAWNALLIGSLTLYCLRYGRMGEQIGRELTRRLLAFVVIERDPKVLEMLRANNVAKEKACFMQAFS